VTTIAPADAAAMAGAAILREGAGRLPTETVMASPPPRSWVA
jgi:hypothetical protein